jgi:hypothetical protein
MSSATITSTPRRIQVLETPDSAQYIIAPPGLIGAWREIGTEFLRLLVGAYLMWLTLTSSGERFGKADGLLVLVAALWINLSFYRGAVIIIQALTATASIFVDDSCLKVTTNNWRGDTRVQWSRNEIERITARQRTDIRSLNPLLPLVFARWSDWVLVVRAHSGEETALLAGHLLKHEISWLTTELRERQLLGFAE